MNSDLETFVPFDYKWRGVQRLAQTATPAHDTKFLVGMGRALYWQSLLATGAMASGSAIARAEGLAPSTVNELRRLFSILLSLAARTLGWLCRAQRLSHSVSNCVSAVVGVFCCFWVSPRSRVGIGYETWVCFTCTMTDHGTSRFAACTDRIHSASQRAAKTKTPQSLAKLRC